MNFGVLELPQAPIVMGALELNPQIDFSAVAQRMVQEGCDIINLSLPGENSVEFEIENLLAAVKVLKERIAIPIAVTTSNPAVMEVVVQAGAKMIYDPLALTKPGAMAMMAKLLVPFCLVHQASNDTEPVAEIYNYFAQRIAACTQAAIDQRRIIIDPGFSLHILRGLALFKNLNCKLLVSMTNDSVIGQILDAPAAQRSFGSLTAEIVAIGRGADIIRTYAVKATVDAIKVIKAV